uniref:LRAT domain-containing protein n=1 Tax=Hucho hucho TaxID=62062 RepID=A0A4W5L726_9TELE
MMRMKLTFILAILLFQLTISVEGGVTPSTTEQGNPEDKYEFGDIIAFPRGPVNKCNYLYNHYAIYVGDKEFPDTSKEVDQDIFHITAVFNQNVVKYGFSNCVFGKLKDFPQHRKDNHLDDNFPKRDDAEIIKDISKLYKNCKSWNPVKNNCEQLSSQIRNGKQNFEQAGTILGYIIKLFRKQNLSPDGKGKRVWLIKTRAYQGAPAA